MTPIVIGAVGLGVAVLGLAVYTWRFLATRELSFSILWLIVPLAGGMIAFMMTPPSLLTASLGGAALVLMILTLALPIVGPVFTEEAPRQEARSRTESRDRAA